MKKIIVVIGIFLLSISNVYALNECTSSEQARLRELANNINFTYEYELLEFDTEGIDGGSPQDAYFKITAHNLTDELIVSVKDSDDLKFTKTNETLSGFYNGTDVNIEFKAYTKNMCSGKTILTKTIKLPKFNLYSLRDECKEYKDFKYCSEYGNYNITDETFLSELEKYKKGDTKEEKNDEGEEEKSNLVYIIAIIITIIIGASIGVVVIINIKKRDSDL